MNLTLPNSAHLQNIEGFLGKCSFLDPSSLNVSVHPRWVSVHPSVISLIACAGALVRSNGGHPTLTIPNPKVASLRYLQRMKLFEYLGADPGLSMVEHEAAGRFIPVTQIRTKSELSDFLVEMIPLLHVSPTEAQPIQYVISEVVRNVLEHSDSSLGAFLCAQYYKESRRLALGVADAGVGIREALAYSHPTPGNLEAILLALRPGVSGTTKKLGGNEYNAGAGLFFTKSIACVGRTYMVVYSGDGFFKLRKIPARAKKILIQPDPSNDYSSPRRGLPAWPGTLIGIDVGLASARRFPKLLDLIGEAYDIDVRKKKAAKFRKPTFI